MAGESSAGYGGCTEDKRGMWEKFSDSRNEL